MSGIEVVVALGMVGLEEGEEPGIEEVVVALGMVAAEAEG